MKMNTSDLIKKIDQKEVAVKEKTVRKTTLQKSDLYPVIRPLVKFVQEELDTGKLAQATLKVAGADVRFEIETNVINLPFEDFRQLKRTVPSKKAMTVNVYIMVASPLINRSKLRIDLISSADEFITKVDRSDLNRWLQTQLKQIRKNVKTAKSVPKATRKAKRTTGRRTRRHRKSTRKRSRK